MKNRKYECEEVTADKIKVGDRRVWNQGTFSEIVKIEETKSGKSLYITTIWYNEHAKLVDGKWEAEWQEDTRTVRKTTKIWIISADQFEEEKEIKSNNKEKLKTIEELQEGDCTIIVKDTTGNIKEFEGYYSSKFEVVFMAINSNYKILGYKQTQEQIKNISNEVIEQENNMINNNNNNDNTKVNIETESENNNATCKVVFNEEKNGIELHFSDKPSLDIRNTIKSIGFKWSKFNKIWYIKNSENVRQQLINMGLMTEDNDNKEVNVDTIDTNNIDVAKMIDINENNFSIDKSISDRENDGHWTFRTEKRNHQQEILNILNDYKNTFINVLNDCNNTSTKNYYINWFNNFMKKYYNNYYNRLKNNANNPSWIATGRSGRNINKDRKYNNRNDNLMRELIELESIFNNKLNKFKSSIEKSKQDFIKNNLENITIDIKELKKEKIKINTQAVDNIFNDTNYEVNCYNYKNEYYIIKNWGYWRIYNHNGIELNLLNRCFKNLEECKKGLIYIIQEKLKEAV